MLIKKILPLFLILNSNISLAQPELRFNPFDWVLYKHTGSINSISFGNRYAFIGTQNGGVVRFNTGSQRFEEPITRSQGLKSDFVTFTVQHFKETTWSFNPILRKLNI